MFFAHPNKFLSLLLLLSFILGTGTFFEAGENAKKMTDLIRESKANAGWERRRKKALMAEGLKGEKLTTRLNQERDTLVEEANKGLEKAVIHYLTSIGFKDSKLNTFSRIQYNFLIEAAGHGMGGQLDAFNRLNQNYAGQLLEQDGNFNTLHKDDITEIAATWESWLFDSKIKDLSSLYPMKMELANKRQAKEKKEREKAQAKKEAKKKQERIHHLIEQRLKPQNLTEEDYKFVYDIEYAIQEEAMNVPLSEYGQKNNQLHAINTAEFIEEHNIIEKNMKEDIKELCTLWESTFYNNEIKRIAAIKKLYQNLKNKKIQNFKKSMTNTLILKTLDGEYLKKILAIEVKIYKELLETPVNKREIRNQALHVIEAEKILTTQQLKIDNYYFNKLKNMWPQWLHMDEKKQKTELRKIIIVLKRERIAEARKNITERLTKKGLSGSPLNTLVSMELKIETALISIEDSQKNQERNILFMKAASDIAKQSYVFKHCPDSFLGEAAVTWKEWLYLEYKTRKTALESIRNTLEAKKIKERLSNPKNFKQNTRKDLESYWKKKLKTIPKKQKATWQKISTGSMKDFDHIWDKLSKKSKRSYESEKTSLKTDLKKSGFPTSAISIFLSGLDKYFKS